MKKPYWIITDTIIFKPEFSHSLNKYVKKISLSKYKKIIFSNYTKPEIAIETNNNYNFEYNNIMMFSSFNQPFGDLLSNLINLQQLSMGNSFNQPFGDSLSKLINLQQLSMGCY